MILRVRVRWEVVIGWLSMLSVSLPQETRGDWQEHRIRQGDGRGVGSLGPPAAGAQASGRELTMPFGLAQMDNGELAILPAAKSRSRRRTHVEPTSPSARMAERPGPSSRRSRLRRPTAVPGLARAAVGLSFVTDGERYLQQRPRPHLDRERRPPADQGRPGLRRRGERLDRPR